MPGPRRANVATTDPGLESLIVSLHGARGKVTDHDIAFLTDALCNKQLQALVNLHAKISSLETTDLASPVTKEASKLSEEILEDIYCNGKSSFEVSQLKDILSNSYFKSLLEAHDCIASKDYEPLLPEVPYEVDEDEETIKIVQLVKSNEPLGATIKHDEKTGKILIARVMHGGAADRSGLIHVGDEVHEVNGINVYGRSPTDVVKILKSVDGTIVFKLIPAEEEDDDGLQSKVRMKAHFDYDPRGDTKIPCREAGITFRKGDILHIVNQNDPNWWQARIDGDNNMRAGLIPGRLLQERRMALQREQKTVIPSPDLSIREHEVYLPGYRFSPICSSPKSPKFRQHKDTKKIMYDIDDFTDYEREELPTYEEVSKLYPRPGLFRPIILIGPPGVGRNELKRLLMATDPNHYKTTIPHTSRNKKDYEVEGQEYYFVSHEEMEVGIRQGKFVEYGEYKGNLYGTSIESIKCIINAGYVGIMNPHPQALKMLRTTEIKPFVVFIKPPEFEVLKETRNSVNARSTFDENNQRGFTDDEFRDMLVSAHKIEFLHGHTFDLTIINDDLVDAFQLLYTSVMRLETEPQWVPANWVA